MIYYIDTNNFTTATSVWTNSILTIKAPDGYYSFGGNYRRQIEGILTAVVSCNVLPPLECTSYTVSTTSSTGQSYTYTACDGTPSSGSVGGAGGYDGDTFCAQTDTVVLIGPELALTNNGTCI